MSPLPERVASGFGLTRLFQNIRRAGIRQTLYYLYYHADSKYGKMIGQDEYGNQYFENLDELPYRNRWVKYRLHDYDGAQVPAEWSSWLHHIQEQPPTENAKQKDAHQKWQPHHVPNVTFTRGAYRPYNTIAPRTYAWDGRPARRTE